MQEPTGTGMFVRAKTPHELAIADTVSIVTAVRPEAHNVIELIGKIHAKMTELYAGTAPTPEPEVPVPAVPVKKSITPDYIICLEDGVKLKSLKRHLSTAFKLTPEQYRTKWGLPADYPMVAPSYSEQRSKFARDHGLGKKR